MNRRDVIRLLTGVAVATPLAARGQQQAVPVIGYLNSASASGWARQLAAFLQGLQDSGYREGRNVAIEYRWADDQYDRLPALAADLVRLKVNVLVANGPAAQPAKAATAAIPIVFTTGADPVRLGLVASLSRPGGNATGISTLNVEMGAKRFELLHELVPTATTIGLLVNPTDPSAETYLSDAQAAARILGLQVRILHASTERDIEATFETLGQMGVAALVIGSDAFLISQSEKLGVLAVRNAVPTISSYRGFPAAGGLMSYGDSLTDLYRQTGIYAGRILRGDRPADLPVQQATKDELVINLKTAKALGLSIPITLLGRADEVIE
jgi:putative ABC transport system substrate-binding protein